MTKINNLNLSATILIASLIIGGFVFGSQIIKQRSIEKQQLIDLQAKIEQKKFDSLIKKEEQQILIDKNNEIEARKVECAEKAQSDAVNMYCDEVGCSKTEPFTAKFWPKDYDYAYKICLESKGLK